MVFLKEFFEKLILKKKSADDNDSMNNFPVCNIVVFQVGYEAGSCGERLPDIYMNDLDSELIPVMHRATQQNHVGTVLELIFHILN